MGGTAFWTAAANRIPLLVIVANDRSFFACRAGSARPGHAREQDPAALAQAIAEVGKRCVVDVIVEPEAADGRG